MTTRSLVTFFGFRRQRDVCAPPYCGADPLDIVIRKLELRLALSPEEKGALRSTFAATREYTSGQDLLTEGERPTFVGALLRGALCCYKALPNGLRQIVALPLPGDILDLHSFSLERIDHSIGALAPSILAIATHAAVEEMTEAHPRLAMLLWRDAVVEAAVAREWVVNCGRRDAHARIAHMLCEIYVRAAAVGLAKDGVCPLPMTQSDVGDATGLSVVHVNRVLQRLRAENLIVFGSGRLTIHDWDGLAKAAGFNPAYLHASDAMRGGRGFAFRPPVDSPSGSEAGHGGGEIALGI